MYDVKNGDIFVSRDVIFQESIFPFATQKEEENINLEVSNLFGMEDDLKEIRIGSQSHKRHEPEPAS